MNTELLVFLVGIACLLIGIIGGIGGDFLIGRPARQTLADERTEHTQILAAKDTTIEHAQARADNAEHSRDLAEDRARLAESLRADDISFLRGQLAASQLKADMFSAAFRGLLTHQARTELLRPDEPVGEVVQMKRKAGK